MKRVVLLGDSIRLGYEATVRMKLADVAHVWSPAENCQHSYNLALNFWTWVVAQQPAVLHLNAGMWDTRHIVRGVAENVVPLEQYRQNVERLIRLAKMHTSARVIWATTTPVHNQHANETHLRAGLAGRDGADIARYNATAVEVARAAGAVINDLHQLVTDYGCEKLLSPDGVHFTPEGYTVLGEAVAQAIRAQL